MSSVIVLSSCIKFQLTLYKFQQKSVHLIVFPAYVWKSSMLGVDKVTAVYEDEWEDDVISCAETQAVTWQWWQKTS